MTMMMKKQIACFLVFLTIFNFISCAKSIDSLYLQYQAPEDAVNNCIFKVKMEGGDEFSYRDINKYFAIYHSAEETLADVNQNGNIIEKFNLKAGTFQRLKIKKIREVKDEKPIFIEFQTEDENVIIGDRVSKTIRIYLHK